MVYLFSAEQGGAELDCQPHEKPHHEDDGEQEKDADGGCLPSLAVDFTDDHLVAVDEAVDEFHVLDVRTMEEVDDISHEKG